MSKMNVNFAGRSFEIDSSDGMDAVAQQLAAGSYEAPLPFVMMATLVRVEGAFIDVGANTGIYSVMASVFAPDRKVVAFEPLPSVLSILRKNLAINNLQDRVTIHEVALSDRNGVASLHLPDPHHGLVETSASLESEFKQAHSIIDVPVKRFDDMNISDFIGVIKADIEGHEYAFLNGARETIMRDRPIIFAEVVGPARRGPMNALLRNIGYMDFRLRPDMALHDGEVLFDDAAWNHALVPVERLAKFREICDSCGLPMFRRFQLS
ncbi:FkbM family methyltransferase [Methylobacterium terrae]|uniref:FkbM family methyltransferase n=1 Tax=Methylobacterium terrae TaxID=2202827 RepID=A0A2U8WRH3_9HYPH|nr:FkbM family methyltransferase [Methylobacterium terrae]AWN48789.1 FkbM family methyltransferase [Methylobacterium terrae]